MLFLILIPFLALGWIYWLIVWLCTWAFLRRAEPGDGYTPSVSLLKPIKGLDAECYENLRSFCRQDYPDYELLLGVADPADPAMVMADRLKREFPSHRIRTLVAPVIGVNPKASILHHLAGAASGEILVVTDSDIRVTPAYLRQTVAPLQNPAVGVVTCPYRAEHARNLTAFLESLYINATFVPSAILAGRYLRRTVGLGASMAVRRSDLAAIGGFGSFADYLADDYQLACRIAALGRRIHLSTTIVATILGVTTFPEQWDRELRWARTVRTSNLPGYLGLPLTFATPWAFGAAIVAPHWSWSAVVLGSTLVMRWVVAWRLLAAMGAHSDMAALPWLPGRDCLTALFWCAGLIGRDITWRGRPFLLDHAGRLQTLSGPVQNPLAAAAQRAIRRLDQWLRRRQGIIEYSTDPRCVLRFSLTSSPRSAALPDGTCIDDGEPVIEIHFWNEHIPLISDNGTDIAWAKEVQRRIRRSLTELAEYVENDRRLDQVKAIRGRAVFVARDGIDQYSRVAERLGFDAVEPDRPAGMLGRCHDFFENFLLWALVWTFNPGGLKNARFRRPRHIFWMSRQTLLRRYGRAAPSAEPFLQDDSG